MPRAEAEAIFHQIRSLGAYLLSLGFSPISTHADASDLQLWLLTRSYSLRLWAVTEGTLVHFLHREAKLFNVLL
jgi:hypothetical protein